MEENFFIKDNYKAKKSFEKKSGDYWTKDRIIQPRLESNYPAYKYCKKLIKKRKLKSVLDIGCGLGEKLMKLIFPICPNVYGIDEERAVEFCHKKYGLNTFFAGDLENLTLDLKKKFDLIISIDVIEHILNPDNLIASIKKFCKKRTYIVMSTPERDILRGKQCESPGSTAHIREWNRKEFAKYLQSRDLRILHHTIILSNRRLTKLKHPYREYINFANRVKRFIYYRRITKKNKHTQLVLCAFNNIS